MRNRILDAVDVLNDLVGDLVTGTNVLREYQALNVAGKIHGDLLPGIRRMCVSHIVLSCCKFIEFYDHFHDLLPENQRAAAKALRREFNTRGMTSFRNKVVGHIWDNNQGRPLQLSEITQQLQVMMKNDVTEFLDWINRLESGVQPDTVAATVEEIRNSLIASHTVSPDEAIRR